jgi:hypothetical protein
VVQSCVCLPHVMTLLANMSRRGQALLTAVILWLASPPTSAEVLASHVIACYERADLELNIKYFRPGMLYDRGGKCFRPPAGSQVTVLRSVDAGNLPVGHLVLVQFASGGRPFWVTDLSVGFPLPEPLPYRQPRPG